MLTGLRRGELFALRWNAVNFSEKHLPVQEAVHEGVFGTPKTDAGTRRVPLAESTLALLTEWRARVKRTAPDALVFATWSGKPISPHNVTRRKSIAAQISRPLRRDSLRVLMRICERSGQPERLA